MTLIGLIFAKTRNFSWEKTFEIGNNLWFIEIELAVVFKAVSLYLKHIMETKLTSIPVSIVAKLI